MNEKEWEEKREDCPCIGKYFSGNHFCTAQNQFYCMYHLCPFVFWYKAEEKIVLKNQLANIPKKKRFKSPEPRYDDVYHEGLEQLDKS